VNQRTQAEYEEYLEALEEMFTSPGWKLLVEEFHKDIYHRQASALEASSWERVCELRGEAKQLAYLANLEGFVEMQRKQLRDAEDASV